ncbi:MAG TPA: carboxypeptidase-like regulatory domain-containing protein, partial [Acidobacteriota bacterium]|nr:carboxypeptidase-like regulatory domain-containing protein [Acidobacteriota bacterium]
MVCRRVFWKALAVVAGLAICVMGQVTAQAVYGTIAGRVVDETGAVLPGAEVTISDVARGTSWTVITDESGNFRRERMLP